MVCVSSFLGGDFGACSPDREGGASRFRRTEAMTSDENTTCSVFVDRKSFLPSDCRAERATCGVPAECFTVSRSGFAKLCASALARNSLRRDVLRHLTTRVAKRFRRYCLARNVAYFCIDAMAHALQCGTQCIDARRHSMHRRNASPDAMKQCVTPCNGLMLTAMQ